MGVAIAHPLTYATIACVRRDGKYSRRPPKRQNSSETILPPPPSFYSADHPLIVRRIVWYQINYRYNFNKTKKIEYFTSLASFVFQDDNQFTKEKQSQSSLSRSNKNGGTLRRVAFKDVPPCDSSSEDICTCSSNNSQQGYVMSLNSFYQGWRIVKYENRLIISNPHLRLFYVLIKIAEKFVTMLRW